MTGMAAGIKTGAPIYEATNKAGGICGSYKMKGYTFAQGGGHWIFHPGPGVEFIKTLVELNEYERKAGVYYNHTFPYPIQTTAKETPIISPGTLQDSLFRKFGTEQCNLFFFPFNQKYTAGLYNSVIQVDDYKSPPAGGKGFCSTFWDPKNGITELVDKMAAKCDIKYERVVDRIWWKENQIEYCYKGQQYIEDYDNIISTVPLDKCLELCGKFDYRLPYTSVLVVNIGGNAGINTPEEHWQYIPFCKTGFYRVGFYTNVNKNYAPEGKVGLSVEMQFRHYEDMKIEETTNKIIAELQSWGWIREVDVVDPTVVKTAYTWLYAEKDRTEALDWLKDKGITSIGRYGKWHFQGMAESIQEGLTVDV